MERRSFLRTSALSAAALGTAGAAGIIGATGTASASETPTASETPSPSAAKPLRVQILVYDGVEEQDFIAPIDVFGLAKSLGGALTTTLVTPGKPGIVTCAYGTRVEVAQGWSPHASDVLVVPGGGYRKKDGPGVHRLIADRDFLRRLASARTMPVGICTGVMALSAAGITKGRPATTHHAAKADLAAQGAQVIDARVVDDGNLITAGGVTSGLDLALWVVERFLGARLAQSVETVLEYERRGTVWRR
ncbi:DJ-1/PfpI family protein [Streptoalloteichus tenebrarius]|uniref:DJ-1/PfpI family protein n=1 Tax=Streptoalloteichus tenebrarius (strain ATCC 17920 / DSM 40477 / JCM 4838 / CBS 697.72 / NBRC 16177 / NCIMB 11028 / NRRL B-12390 / A12253. 1 / ISP 5477) TaxID=1933 RepID=A0ABT1HLF0_STRSD|nr:DJ-1/PfpI family protein [Streptoalloteichus tenebrarius]MCP2256342.1 DJ-1/PfpI family protein [Streptoalloteichus tenebrarius]BFF04682.1 DJ-1/PfpI family protein [Streptoalloteichus tenebrarius]